MELRTEVRGCWMLFDLKEIDKPTLELNSSRVELLAIPLPFATRVLEAGKARWESPIPEPLLRFPSLHPWASMSQE